MKQEFSEAIAHYRSLPLERTLQRLDPVGVQSAWSLVPLLGLVTFCYALYSTFVHRDQLRSPASAAAALAVLLLAVVLAAVRTHPRLSPFGRSAHLTTVGVMMVSACLFASAVWGNNERIQDDWGQIAVALLLMVMSLYRPVAEVLVVAVVAAGVLGALAALQTPSLVIANHPLVYIVVASAPVLALTCSGAGYAWTKTGETLRWREFVRAGRAGIDGELRQVAERMVVQERTTALNIEAAPFLSEVIARGTITDADREQARRIADQLRAAAIGVLERTWLAETFAFALASRGAEAVPMLAASRVHDPDRLDRVLSDEQRVIVGALVATIVRMPGLDGQSVRATVSEPAHPTFVLTARVLQSHRSLRKALMPFLSVLRSTGLSASMRTRGGDLTVRFACSEKG